MTRTTRLLAAATMLSTFAAMAGFGSGAIPIGGALKMIGSCFFLATAVSAGAFRSGYGRLILLGLFFSWWGDLFLNEPELKNFLWGLIAFWLGHAAYCAAYLSHRGRRPLPPETAVLIAVGACFVWAWLAPHVGPGLRGPVIAYIAVISLMVALAFGTAGRPGHHVLIWGAILFYLSDIFVARQRFVAPGPLNGAIGLPLYYLGQTLLAVSIAYTHPRASGETSPRSEASQGRANMLP